MKNEYTDAMHKDDARARDDAAGAAKLNVMEDADASVTAMVVHVIGRFMQSRAATK